MSGNTSAEPVTVHSEASRADRIITVSITMFCQGFQALALGGIALFLPNIRADLGLSYTQAGILASLATLTYALMQIPAGFLVDRFGPRKLGERRFHHDDGGAASTRAGMEREGLISEIPRALAVHYPIDDSP